MRIRKSTSNEHDLIRGIHLDAFDDSERAIDAQLACDILVDETASPVLSLVAEEQGKIVGNIIFSTVSIEGSDDTSAFILAPLAVVTDCQKKCIGTTLIEKGLADLVFVYGDPAYYSRSGVRASYSS